MKKGLNKYMDKSSIENCLFEATTYFNEGKYDEAANIYLQIEKYSQYRAGCHYLLAHISNAMNDPLTAYELYYSAFKEKGNVISEFLDKKHKNHGYIFTGMIEEKEFKNCILCGKAGEPYWCYSLPESALFTSDFNPVRMWLKCNDCNHLFAKSFPENLTDSYDLQAREDIFPYYEEILNMLKTYCKGNELLEIGIGGCECALVARNMGFNVFGMDINEKQVEYARTQHGLNAEVHDFIKFETDKKWDVIIMGDVIEHVKDPVAAMQKVSELLADNGVIWISTPDFESEFTIKTGHNDPMRREAWHINYFSKDSLYALLRRFGFLVMEHKESKHYNGSMEVIAVKGE
ncbi:MAG: class I SAM-dependent methyltransferase [Oscillospiraceae bacterium]|nr:class I SAM-dependent methyltransferase [Oscillospiraceae bacterium]